MDYALLFPILLAFAVFLLRLLKLERRKRRRAGTVLLMAGGAASGLTAGLFGLDDDFGLAVTGVTALGFALAAALAYWLGREPKKTKSARGPQSFMQEERHDYTRP